MVKSFSLLVVLLGSFLAYKTWFVSDPRKEILQQLAELEDALEIDEPIALINAVERSKKISSFFSDQITIDFTSHSNRKLFILNKDDLKLRLGRSSVFLEELDVDFKDIVFENLSNEKIDVVLTVSATFEVREDSNQYLEASEAKVVFEKIQSRWKISSLKSIAPVEY